jgi:hypothetical protein
MQKTRIATLAWTSLIAIPIGWSIGRLVHNATAELLPIPALLPAFLVLFAAAMFAGARAVRGWIRERRHDRHLGPLQVARILALAKAAEYFGAVIVGAYVGIAGIAIDHLAVPMGREGLLMAGLVAVAGALATVAAVVLERSCLVPPSDEDPQNE